MILVVGSGFLGGYFLKHAAAHTDARRVATVRTAHPDRAFFGARPVPCDVSRESDLHALADVCGGEPLTVFYFAACHNVDFIYTHPEQARAINIDALRRFLTEIPNIDRLIFASTDCVYGENTAEYPRFGEDAPLRAVNAYGRQKAEAEQIVLAQGYTVARLPFMLGPSLSEKPHFYDTVCAKLRRNEEIEMIDGMTRSVLSYADAAELLFALAALPKAQLPDVVNVCGDRSYGKYDMGLVLAKRLGAPTSLVKRLTEAQGAKFFQDRRASCAVMDNTRLKTLLGRREIVWEEDVC